jgi:hypothetical protein
VGTSANVLFSGCFRWPQATAGDPCFRLLLARSWHEVGHRGAAAHAASSMSHLTVILDDMWPTASDDEPRLEVHGELHVRTESSLWVIRPDRYIRMPLVEGAREPLPSEDDALDDLEWHPQREVRLVETPAGLRLRIVPANRSDDARGVITGVIVTSMPALDLVPHVESTDEAPPTHCSGAPGMIERRRR